MAEKKQLFISSYALLEFVWALKSKGQSKQIIYESLLDSPGIVVGNREILIIALERFYKNKADFADCLILAESEAYQAPRIASFDKKFCCDFRHCMSPAEFL